MRKTLAVVVVSLAVVCLAAGQSKTRRSARPAAPAAADDAAAGEQLRTRLQQVMNAWSSMDPENAAKYYANDADLVFFDLTPLQYKGWDEYYLGARKLFANYQEVSIRLRQDAQVHWKGDMAYATAIWDVYASKADGAKEQLALRWTLILERRDGDWLVVHQHVSAPLTPAAAPASNRQAQPEQKKDQDIYK